MMRSIAAVILGYCTMAIAIGILFAIWFRDPNTKATLAFDFGSLVYGFAWAATGGYVVARVARNAEWKHIGALVMLLLLFTIVSMTISAGKEPLWYQCANMFVMSSGVITGGFFRLTQKRANYVIRIRSGPAL